VSENARVIFRFSFNQKTGKSNNKQIETDVARAANLIITNVAITYSNRNYKKLTSRIRRSVALAVSKEINHAATQWAKLIGRPGYYTGPVGMIDSKEEGATSFNLGSYGDWNKRSTRYLRDKKTQYRHTKWFYSTGLLRKSLGSGGAWASNFGPIQVIVTRNGTLDRNADHDPKYLSSSQRNDRSTLRSQHKIRALGYQPRDGKKKISIGTIRVRALTKITPGDLPSLASGITSFEGNVSGLIKNKEVRARVAGSGPYRPTLEPFLSFVLTRAIPHAVRKKIADGMNTTPNKA